MLNLHKKYAITPFIQVLCMSLCILKCPQYVKSTYEIGNNSIHPGIAYVTMYTNSWRMGRIEKVIWLSIHHHPTLINTAPPWGYGRGAPSSLLGLCDRNQRGTGEFPSRRVVMQQSFTDFFHVNLNYQGAEQTVDWRRYDAHVTLL